MKTMIQLIKDNLAGSGLIFVWAAFAFLSTAFFLALFIKVITYFYAWL